ncbi:MAG: response regulator transcription factor [Chloroflexi bacterium]|nr:response regulator transcription factor [Chloroflexota bacterium]
MQILVADDDPVYRNLLQGLLEESHFEAVLAADGAEAWAILQRPDAPTFAILDWMMPEMDGYEVCRKIREAKGDSIPYILLMTSDSRREELLKVLIAGADDYLLKPFEPLDLKIRLRTGIRILNFEEQFGPASIK